MKLLSSEKNRGQTHVRPNPHVLQTCLTPKHKEIVQLWVLLWDQLHTKQSLEQLCLVFIPEQPQPATICHWAHTRHLWNHLFRLWNHFFGRKKNSSNPHRTKSARVTYRHLLHLYEVNTWRMAIQSAFLWTQIICLSKRQGILMCFTTTKSNKAVHLFLFVKPMHWSSNKVTLLYLQSPFRQHNRTLLVLISEDAIPTITRWWR